MNLNRALASSGISVGAVSTAKTPEAAPDTVTPTAAPEAEASSGGLCIAGLAGIGAGALVLILAIETAF
jgi:hypothetical protein